MLVLYFRRGRVGELLSLKPDQVIWQTQNLLVGLPQLLKQVEDSPNAWLFQVLKDFAPIHQDDVLDAFVLGDIAIVNLVVEAKSGAVDNAEHIGKWLFG